MADNLATIDDIIDHAREISERGHRVMPLKGRDALEAYCNQHRQIVVYVRLGTGEEHEITFRADGPLVRLNDAMSTVAVMNLHGVKVGERGYELPMPVSTGDVGEDVEAIVPTLVCVERPQKRTNFHGELSHCFCLKSFVEPFGASLEGKASVLDELATTQPGALGNGMVEGVFQHVAGDVGPDLKFGIGSLGYSEFVRVLSYLDIWFNDDGPCLCLAKPLDVFLKSVDVAFGVFEE